MSVTVPLIQPYSAPLRPKGPELACHFFMGVPNSLEPQIPENTSPLEQSPVSPLSVYNDFAMGRFAVLFNSTPNCAANHRERVSRVWETYKSERKYRDLVDGHATWNDELRRMREGSLLIPSVLSYVDLEQQELAWLCLSIVQQRQMYYSSHSRYQDDEIKQATRAMQPNRFITKDTISQSYWLGIVLIVSMQLCIDQGLHRDETMFGLSSKREPSQRLETKPEMLMREPLNPLQRYEYRLQKFSEDYLRLSEECSQITVRHAIESLRSLNASKANPPISKFSYKILSELLEILAEETAQQPVSLSDFDKKLINLEKWINEEMPASTKSKDISFLRKIPDLIAAKNYKSILRSLSTMVRKAEDVCAMALASALEELMREIDLMARNQT